jgi:hypothetical protein
VAAGLAGRQGCGAAFQAPVSREKLSPQQSARLEVELRKGPLAHGFAADQRWTMGRIKTLISRLFHVGYTAEGVWKAEVWPDIKAPRAAWAPMSASRTRRARA